MYEEIIAHAPKAAQKRIAFFVKYVNDTHTPSEIRELCGVKNLYELVQHLVEFECGTPYDVSQPPIEYYRYFLSRLGEMKDDIVEQYQIRQAAMDIGDEQ